MTTPIVITLNDLRETSRSDDGRLTFTGTRLNGDRARITFTPTRQGAYFILSSFEDGEMVYPADDAELGKTPASNYFAAVYLDHHDDPAEAAEQVMRATLGVLKAAGDMDRQLYTMEADTGNDSPGVLIATAELSPPDVNELFQAYPYDEDVLHIWEQKGWEAVSGE